MNVVILSGNLTDAPELRYTGSDTPVANATLATNQRYNDRDGNLVEDVTYHDLVIWGKQAEVISEYADKGQNITLRGAIQTSTWEDDHGQSRRDVEVKVLKFDFGPRMQQDEDSGSPEPAEAGGQSQDQSGSDDEDTFEPDDELPF